MKPGPKSVFSFGPSSIEVKRSFTFCTTVVDSVQLQKRAQEVAARGKTRRAGHEHDHDLVGRKAALDEHVPQKAAAGHLVVGRHFEVCEQLADVCDDLIRGLVLGHAAVHGDDVVRAALVDAGDDAPRASCRTRPAPLVAVVVPALSMPMIGSTCANCPSSFGAEAVFPFELFRIGQVLKLAAAALLLCGQRLFSFCAVMAGASRFLWCSLCPYSTIRAAIKQDGCRGREGAALGKSLRRRAIAIFLLRTAEKRPRGRAPADFEKVPSGAPFCLFARCFAKFLLDRTAGRYYDKSTKGS